MALTAASISASVVDQFDTEVWPAMRQPGDPEEPGDHPAAPYRLPHFRATSNERLLADTLGVDWAEYEAEINALP